MHADITVLLHTQLKDHPNLSHLVLACASSAEGLVGHAEEEFLLEDGLLSWSERSAEAHDAVIAATQDSTLSAVRDVAMRISRDRPETRAISLRFHARLDVEKRGNAVLTRVQAHYRFVPFLDA